jgi:hypothetical protein
MSSGVVMCEHYDCRCALARELAAIADRNGTVRELVRAIDVHSCLVPCQREPDQRGLFARAELEVHSGNLSRGSAGIGKTYRRRRLRPEVKP